MREDQTFASGAQAARTLRLYEVEAPSLREESDEGLMLRHGTGDEAAFGELLRRHQKPVLNYMYRMIQNRHIAEELTQEVFVALVKNAGRYQPTAKFTTYMYTIASNIVSKEWLRRKRRPMLLSLSAAFGRNKDTDEEFNPLEHIRDERANVATQTQRNEVSVAVNRALASLPAHQREAFVLHRFRDLSYDEISEITESPVGTIKSRVVRAERALRPLLEKYREYLSGR